MSVVLQSITLWKESFFSSPLLGSWGATQPSPLENEGITLFYYNLVNLNDKMDGIINIGGNHQYLSPRVCFLY